MRFRLSTHAKQWQWVRRGTIFVAVPTLVVATLVTQSGAISGNIGNLVIQIDGGAPGADLYPGLDGTPADILNPPATADWVANADAGASTDCVPPAGVTVTAPMCYDVGTTSATTTGNWSGTRIIDSVGTNEQDQFIKGGKENDEGTWNVGGGSVGSSKYDITQAYLANNSNDLFFGMERRGNNGTTAFDFEFNQKPGQSSLPAGATCSVNNVPAASCPGMYFPTRNPGDLLFTYQMSGSGTSGSATPFIFKWVCTNGSLVVTNAGCAGSYQTLSPAPVPAPVTSINNAPTPAAPWGYVNAKGNWTAGPSSMQTSSDSTCTTAATSGECLSNFEFAEAMVPLSVFPNFSACATNPYHVQIRTRSSATDTSDLKDTTGIFTYSFTAGAAPTVVKSSAEGGTPSVTLTGTSDSGDTRNWWESQSPNGRVVTDGATTASSTTVTSATANFTNADVGEPISGGSIPANTTIASVTDSHTAVLSNSATAAASSVTFYIDLVAVTNGAGQAITDNGTTSTQLVYSNFGTDSTVTTTRASFGVSNPAPEQDPATLGGGGTFGTGTWYYVVTAITGAGETAGSNERSATATSGSTNSFTVSWEQLAGATGYKIYRGTAKGGENVLVGTVNSGSTTSFTDDDVVQTSPASPTANNVGGNPYVGALYTVYFQISATDASQCTAFSAPVLVSKLVAVDP